MCSLCTRYRPKGELKGEKRLTHSNLKFYVHLEQCFKVSPKKLYRKYNAANGNRLNLMLNVAGCDGLTKSLRRSVYEYIIIGVLKNQD